MGCRRNTFSSHCNSVYAISCRLPKVQAAIAANTYVISGPSEEKALQDLLPSIVSQLGMDNLSQLQSMAAQAGAAGAGAPAAEDDDDDDVPDLVEGNFEEVSEN